MLSSLRERLLLPEIHALQLGIAPSHLALRRPQEAQVKSHLREYDIIVNLGMLTPSGA